MYNFKAYNDNLPTDSTIIINLIENQKTKLLATDLYEYNPDVLHSGTATHEKCQINDLGCLIPIILGEELPNEYITMNMFSYEVQSKLLKIQKLINLKSSLSSGG